MLADFAQVRNRINSNDMEDWLRNLLKALYLFGAEIGEMKAKINPSEEGLVQQILGPTGSDVRDKEMVLPTLKKESKLLISKYRNKENV